MNKLVVIVVPLVIILVGFYLTYLKLKSNPEVKTLEEKMAEINQSEMLFFENNPNIDFEKSKYYKTCFQGHREDALKEHRGYPLAGAIVLLASLLVGFIFIAIICLAIKVMLYPQFARICLTSFSTPVVCFDLVKTYSYWLGLLMSGLFSIALFNFNPVIFWFVFAGGCVACYLILL